jgi:hypothetical protein
MRACSSRLLTPAPKLRLKKRVSSLEACGPMLQNVKACMSIFFRRLSALGIILAVHSTAVAQSAALPVPPPDWPVTSAPARFIIEPNQEGPKRVSWVKLCLPALKWIAMPMRVFTDTGTAVGSDLLWTAPGEPATLLFDSSSGARRYKVYVGSNWPALHLPDAKAGVRLEVREGDGKEINHLPEMLQAWNQSGKVLGRALLEGINEGGNRFGPEADLFEHFQGWFEVAAPEQLQMGAISTDASFVLVDGKEVVEWPGAHAWNPGHDGPPQGGVDLAAGIHVVDYYNAYVHSDRQGPIMCALAVKGGPFYQWTLLRPESAFFRPVAEDHIIGYELPAGSPGASMPGAAPALAMDWSNADQSVIDPDIPDIGLISMQLTFYGSATGAQTVNWAFDDGTTAQGKSVTHLFPRPGMRKVRLSLNDGARELASLTQTISVHADWEHPGKGPQLLPVQEADIMGRDPATLSASDLGGCIAVLGTYEMSDDLVKLVPAVCAKMNEINEADLPYVKEAALFLAQDDWAHFTEEIQLLRALIDRSASVQPNPQMITLAGQSRLALARLVLENSDKTDEVRSDLDAINVSSLNGEERRRLAILRADLALATGDVAGARRQYQAQTGAPSGPDARSSIRRTAQIGQARAFLDRKDFDAAEAALNEVSWQAPIEKMSEDWALTRLRLYDEENLPVVAYLWARRLLPVITENGRSELLFRLTDLAIAQGDNDLAKKTLSELLQKHPYSEEAAQAKERWPGKG